MKNFYLPPLLPQNFAFCAKSTFLVAKLQGILFFGINYIFQIKYFIKKVKRNVQFMHAVAELSTYFTKILQRVDNPLSVGVI